MLHIAGGILLALVIIMLLPILENIGLFILFIIGVALPPLIAYIVAPDYITPIMVVYGVGLYIWTQS